ncbi:MAG: hypothetical protein R3F47_07610 [Gammaproteobacteria bacterium]
MEGGKSKFRQADREQSLKNLMTVNLLKRLESSVAAFRLTLQGLQQNHTATLERIRRYWPPMPVTGLPMSARLRMWTLMKTTSHTR